VITLKRTHWGHCDHIGGYFLKEVSMSGSDSWWIHANKIVKEPRVFIQNVPSGYFEGYIEKVISM